MMWKTKFTFRYSKFQQMARFEQEGFFRQETPKYGRRKFINMWIKLNAQLGFVISKIILFNYSTLILSMKPTHQIITPLLKPDVQTSITTSFSHCSQEKKPATEQMIDGMTSLQLLKPTNKEDFLERRKSAFSIFDGNNNGLNESGCDEDGDSSEYSEEISEKLGRKGRWRKRDKRQQSRLETKNLNRYFRSKINEMLRDIKLAPVSEEESRKADEILQRLNNSNKIMFSEIRQIIKDNWLQEKLRKSSGILLRYIHGGKMGMQSKLIMLKYFNKILKAIRNPQNFTCWK